MHVCLCAHLCMCVNVVVCDPKSIWGGQRTALLVLAFCHVWDSLSLHWPSLLVCKLPGILLSLPPDRSTRIVSACSWVLSCLPAPLCFIFVNNVLNQVSVIGGKITVWSDRTKVRGPIFLLCLRLQEMPIWASLFFFDIYFHCPYL